MREVIILRHKIAVTEDNEAMWSWRGTRGYVQGSRRKKDMLTTLYPRGMISYHLHHTPCIRVWHRDYTIGLRAWNVSHVRNSPTSWLLWRYRCVRLDRCPRESGMAPDTTKKQKGNNGRNCLCTTSIRHEKWQFRNKWLRLTKWMFTISINTVSDVSLCLTPLVEAVTQHVASIRHIFHKGKCALSTYEAMQYALRLKDLISIYLGSESIVYRKIKNPLNS